LNLGFVGTRFAGIDGVSLETKKLITVATRLGHTCFLCAGELEDQERAVLVPEMHFNHPGVMAVSRAAFGSAAEPAGLRSAIAALAGRLERSLAAFVDRFGIDVLIPENALCIPMNIPLGVALKNFIAATGIPTVAHHHDFFWERERFANSPVADLIEGAFPPNEPSIQHVVINSLAQRALWERCGISSVLLPNVMDFDTPPPGVDEFNQDFRQAIGLGEDDVLILQPTRVVPRKRIELAIELVARLEDPRCKLVVSHPAGDEGWGYQRHLMALAEERQVDLRFISERVGSARGLDAAGRKVYSVWDVYVHADFVTYPSGREGFGNALLEAVYFRLPVMVNRYPVYVADIAPLGFQFVEIDGAVTDETVRAVRDLLTDADRRQAVAEINFALGRRHFSFAVLRRVLSALLERAALPKAEPVRSTGRAIVSRGN